MPKTVYIAMPWKVGRSTLTLRRALWVAQNVLEHGHLPFLPQLWMFWDIYNPKKGEEWDALEKQWMEKCDVILWLRSTKGWTSPLYTHVRKLEKPIYRSLQLFKKGMLMERRGL